MDYQVMPELTPEEYAELKADISQRGVMVPIEYDELLRREVRLTLFKVRHSKD